MNNIKKILFLLYAAFAALSCSDWTDIEPVDINYKDASQQDPELWARYMTALRAYKLESEHYITYASFNNGAETSKDEGAYLRSLPDSLDFVSLANAEHITAYDREDIPVLQEKNTRVLYLVDYAARMNELADASKLGAWLDKAMATAKELDLDGFAFTGIPLYGGTDADQTARKEAAKQIVEKLSAYGKTLVFEGDPAFVANAGQLDKLNYVVLNTADIGHAVALKLYVTNMLNTHGEQLPKEKIILAAKIGNKIMDEENQKQDAVVDMTDRVVSLGHLGGLAIYNPGGDYQPVQMNYQTCRTAIQLMNPSK